MVHFWSSRAHTGAFKFRFGDVAPQAGMVFVLGLVFISTKLYPIGQIHPMACFHAASGLRFFFYIFKGLFRHGWRSDIICSSQSLDYLLSGPLEKSHLGQE